jgi:hypothetical protein
MVLVGGWGGWPDDSCGKYEAVVRAQGYIIYNLLLDLFTMFFCLQYVFGTYTTGG